MKKTLKALLVIVLVVAIVIGAVTGVTYYRKGNKTVDVYSVSMLNLGYYEDTTTSEGVVKNNASQSIYVTDGQKVIDVYVTEGQEVSEGDPLMAYDVTSLELSVAMKKLQIESFQNEYDTGMAKLNVLKNTTPIPDTPASPSEVPTESSSGDGSKVSDGVENSSGDTGSDGSTSSDGSTTAGTSETANITKIEQKLSGDGTAANPYVFQCALDSKVSGTVLNALKTSSLVARFDAVDSGKNVIMSVTMNGAYMSKTYSDDDMIYIFSGNETSGTGNGDGTNGIIDSDDNALTSDTTDDNLNPAGDNTDSQNQSGYTAKELAQEIATQERSLRAIDIKKRTAENELTVLEEQLEDGIVRSKVNGVVKTVHEIDDIPNDGSAFMVVSGSEGLYIEGSVSELMLDTIKIGQKVTAYDWESGGYYEGEISEIDTIPSSGNVYYGEGNPNVSNYGYTAYIEDPSGLMAGQYLELTIDSSDASGADKMYIPQCYVRDENGKSYVYKDNNGKLEKQDVVTGSILWGSYIEIKSGLTLDDYVAFPYGKNVKEGTATVVSEDMY